MCSVPAFIFHLPFQSFLEPWIRSFHAFFYDGKSRIYCCAQTSRTKKKKKSISTFEDEICWFAGCRVRAEVSIEELAHQRDPHRPPPLPHRTKCTMMNFLGAERVLLRIRNFDLTGMGSSGNYSPFSPSCFFNQFCRSVCPFFISGLGNWETQITFLLPPPQTYKEIFSTVSRESLLFAS